MPAEASAIDWNAVAAIGTIALAVVTSILAAATVYLGVQTRNVSAKTGALAATSAEEMALLRDQTLAMQDLAAAGGRQLEELREARFAEFLPMLRWQSPRCSRYVEGPMISYVGAPQLDEPLQLAIDVICTNEGPGPARLLGARLECDTGEVFRAEELDIPSTIPSGVRLEPLKLRSGPHRNPDPGRRALEISVRYGDLLGEFEYVTRVLIEATFADSGCEARFLESDERSALERRVTDGRARISDADRELT